MHSLKHLSTLTKIDVDTTLRTVYLNGIVDNHLTIKTSGR